MSTVDIKIGKNTYTGVDTIKVDAATGTGTYDFKYAQGIVGSGNINLMVDGNLWQTISVAGGTYIDIPTSPKKTGYAFGGWSTSSSATSPNVVFPYLVSENDNLTWYAVFTTWSCTVTGLGNQSPSSVVFSDSGVFPTLPERQDSLGNVFIEIPTMYRKVNTATDGQITSFTMSTTNVDGTYQPYSVFVAEDGSTVKPYVWMGKYWNTSASGINSASGTAASKTIGAGRTAAKALGTGYQIYDWQFQKLWQDLLMCKMKQVNINSGGGISVDQLGFRWDSTWGWIDGVATGSGNIWLLSKKPSTYIDSPSASTTGYFTASYQRPTSDGCVKKLGYDSANPFFNYPDSQVYSDSNYATYYCDVFYSSSTVPHPVSSDVGYADANSGPWLCDVGSGWSRTYGVRLCYRP